MFLIFFFQAEDGIRDAQESRGLGDVYKRQAFRSGTFDIATPGGAAQTVTITPQEFTDLRRYVPGGWTCKSGGAAYPFTTEIVAGHAPWTSITLTVLANKAVSCTQQVTFLT